MPITKDQAVKRAREDAAMRAGVSESEVKQLYLEDADFPDMSLGAGESGEMSAMMLASGWRIGLSANGQEFEYRANRDQLRLFNYKGKNYRLQ